MSASRRWISRSCERTWLSGIREASSALLAISSATANVRSACLKARSDAWERLASETACARSRLHHDAATNAASGTNNTPRRTVLSQVPRGVPPAYPVTAFKSRGRESPRRSQSNDVTSAERPNRLSCIACSVTTRLGGRPGIQTANAQTAAAAKPGTTPHSSDASTVAGNANTKGSASPSAGWATARRVAASAPTSMANARWRAQVRIPRGICFPVPAPLKNGGVRCVGSQRNAGREMPGKLRERRQVLLPSTRQILFPGTGAERGACQARGESIGRSLHVRSKADRSARAPRPGTHIALCGLACKCKMASAIAQRHDPFVSSKGSGSPPPRAVPKNRGEPIPFEPHGVCA